MEATQQQDCSALKNELAKQTDKMMSLKLSQLKKRAKKSGIADEVIEAAAAGADDEDDIKCVLISLIIKAACFKRIPSPTRGRRQSPEEDPNAQTCLICPGCIRPPHHEGPCCDGQCNDIFPEPPKDESAIDVAAEMARHKVVKEGVLRKVEEAARQEAAVEKQARLKEAEEEARRQAMEAEKKQMEKEALSKAAAAEEEARRRAAEDEARRRAAEKEAARQKAAEVDAFLEQAARQKAAEEAQQKAAEEESRQKAAENEEAAAFLFIEEARARRRAEEEAEFAAMDERCVDTFLECVKTCPWRDRIRTPIKGTILYTKHIRPCRACGTSVDVKDSSFRSLGIFLQFLEKEGLLRLKPGLTDPVVTEICYDACRNYKYASQGQTFAKQETRKDGGYPVISVATGMQWQ